MISKVVYAYPRESRRKVLTLWSLLNENKNLSRVDSNQNIGCHRKGVGFAEEGGSLKAWMQTFSTSQLYERPVLMNKQFSCRAFTAENAWWSTQH